MAQWDQTLDLTTKTIKPIAGRALDPQRSTNGVQTHFKPYFDSGPFAATPRSQKQLTGRANATMVGGYANAISLDLHSTTANRCTDGRQQRCTLHLWQRERLAAILSEAVPIWMETTALLYGDDSSGAGAEAARATQGLSFGGLQAPRPQITQSGAGSVFRIDFSCTPVAPEVLLDIRDLLHPFQPTH
ncbi:hypothetical protein EYF80_022003 [Liparis tanakae]|uniref:Uncharacterized protein n=1 Tax=Liparis tanakae TaxID=230148 RepID=A0A4Z2HPS7_9TELE|nr:hypothetical protein EYF80_022003 [Liparis tanakae]